MNIDETITIKFPDHLLGYYAKSERGDRTDQQDSFAIQQNEMNDMLAVICDGMGGLSGGKYASETTVHIFKDSYVNKKQFKGLPEYLFHYVNVADSMVYQLTDENGNKLNAGTTAVVLTIQDNHLYYLSVGDSRIYIIRNQQIYQMTKDHNYSLILNEQHYAEKMPKEIYEKEMKLGESLISYVGMNGLEYISYNPKKPIELLSGDYILMCSDGLYKRLSNYEILEIIQNNTNQGLEFIVNELMKRTSESQLTPKQDNTTVILISYI